MTFYGTGPDPEVMPEDEPKQFIDKGSTISALWLAVVTLERKVKELEEKIEYLERDCIQGKVYK
jgi:hypothetical protein